jgi:HK97 family phage major capsid protein
MSTQGRGAQGSATPGDPVNRVTAAIESIEAGVQNLSGRLTELELRSRERRDSVPGLEDEAKSFSYLRAVDMISRNADLDDKKLWEQGGAGFEREVFIEAAKVRNQQQGVDTTGGYLVPPEISNDLIERLRSKTALGMAGARILTGVRGVPYVLNKHTGGATAQWVGENEAPSSTTHTFGQVVGRPHRVADVAKISKRLIRLNDPSAEAIIRDDLSRTMALAIEQAALNGSGANNQPLGLAGMGLTDRGPSNGALAVVHVHAMIASLEDSDADMTGPMAIITRPAVLRAFRQLLIHTHASQTANYDYLFAPGGFISDEQMNSITGYRWITTNNVPLNGVTVGNTTVYFGNWSELLIPVWGGLELRASDVTGDSSGSAMLKDQLWILAQQEVDVMVRHLESFSWCDDIDI